MRRKYAAFAIIAMLLLIFSIFYIATNNIFEDQSKQTLKIYCATSLQFPLVQVEADFEKAYPNIDMQVEGHGTIQVIRHVTELDEQVDLLLVADYSLIPIMMYNTQIPNTGENFANYYIRFATNSLVLAYTNNSKYANEVNAENWYEVLTRPSVRLGFANPQLAALGYRSLTAIQLAENHYNSPRLFHDLITANMNPPINSIPDGSNFTITVPSVQEPVGDKLTLRSSEIDLIALLETGYLDYCFLYVSNAKQYGFNYIELPDEINMGSPQYQSVYETVQVVYQHQRYSTISLDRTGEQIYYGLTIPKNAPNPDLAVTFVEFLLNAQGKTDFEQAWHPVFSPSFTDNLQALPENLQALVIPEP